LPRRLGDGFAIRLRDGHRGVKSAAASAMGIVEVAVAVAA
jgi:hypothetical protein